MVTTLNSHCVVGIVEDDRAVRDALCNLLASVGLDVAAFCALARLVTQQRPVESEIPA